MISPLTRSHESLGGDAPPKHDRRPAIWGPSLLACGCCMFTCSMLTGCGGDKGGTDERQEGGCFIDVSVNGALSYEQTHRDLFCLYPTSVASGISAIFIPYDEPFDAITLDVDEIKIDEVGTFPGSLTFGHQDGRNFRADNCEVSIDTHEPDGEDTESGLSYRLHGTGTCASPAASMNDPSETLTISDFKFAAGVVWVQ